jgi:hypothetical protein
VLDVDYEMNHDRSAQRRIEQRAVCREEVGNARIGHSRFVINRSESRQGIT